MAENRTLYLPSHARVDPSELRLLGSGATVTEHAAGVRDAASPAAAASGARGDVDHDGDGNADGDGDGDAHVTLVWPDVRMTLRVLPSAFAASNRLGLASYVASQCAQLDPAILERLEAREQVLALTMEPGLDADGRCETVIRGVAELHDAIIRYEDALYDAKGVCLAHHRDDDDGIAPD